MGFQGQLSPQLIFRVNFLLEIHIVGKAVYSSKSVSTNCVTSTPHYTYFHLQLSPAVNPGNVISCFVSGETQGR